VGIKQYRAVPSSMKIFQPCYKNAEAHSCLI